MGTLPTLISILIFRRLLFDLLEHQPNVCVRFRLLGEMWKPNFLRIAEISEKGATFKDEITGKFVSVNDLNNIMQFEIDARFKEFHPHYHYEIKPEKVS